MVLEFTGLDQDAWWQQARLKVYGERIAAGIRYYAELGNRYLRDQQLSPTGLIRCSFAADTIAIMSFGVSHLR